MRTIEAYNYKIGLDVSSLQGGGIITRRELSQIRRDIGALQDPVEKSAAKLDRLRSALNKGGLDASVYAESVRRIKDSFPEAIAAKQRMAEVERQGSAIRKGLMNEEQQYRAEVSRTAALVKQGGLTHDEARQHLRKYRESMPEAIAMQKRLAEAEREAASIRRSLMTDSQRYREEVLRVKAAVRDGGLTHEEAKLQLDNYRKSMPAAVAEQKRLAEAEREVQRITAAGRSDRQLYAAEKQRLAGLVRNHGLAESEARRHLAAYASTLPGVIAAERQRQAALAQVAAIVARNETAAERYQRQLRELNQLHRSGALDARTYGREMQRMQAEMRGGESAVPAVGGAGMTGMIGQLKTLAAGYVTLQAVTSTFEKSFAMENAQKTFEVFTGSVEKGKQLYGDLVKISSTSPISFDAYASSAQTLLSYNATVESIIPSLDMLGNIAAGDQERFKRLAFAFGQVTAAGILQGDELRQLIEGGFNPLAIISKQTGEHMTSLKKRMAEGQISVEMVRQAMESITGSGGRFYKLLEERSKTAGGAVAKLKSELNLLQAAVGTSFHADIAATANSLSSLVASIRGLASSGDDAKSFGSEMASQAIATTNPITLGMRTWRQFKDVVEETKYEFQVMGALGTGILTDLSNAGENLLRGDWDKVRGAFNGDYTYGLLKEAEAAEKARIAIRDKKTEEAETKPTNSTGVKIDHEKVAAQQAESNKPMLEEIASLKDRNLELTMGAEWLKAYKLLNSGADEIVKAEHQALVKRNAELERGKKITEQTDALQKQVATAREAEFIKRRMGITDDSQANQLAELRALGATSTELERHRRLQLEMVGIDERKQQAQNRLAEQKQLETDAESIRDSLRSPHEELAEDFQRLNQMYQSGLLAADQYAAAKMRAAREMLAIPDDLATQTKTFGDGSEIYAARVEDQNRREKQLLESLEAQRLQSHVNALARTEQQRLNTQRQITDQMRQQAIAASQMQRPGANGPAGQTVAGEGMDDPQLERIADAAERTAAAISNWQIIGV